MLNEYHSGEYSKSEFEGKVSTLVKDGKISQEASEKVIHMVFEFKHDPDYGTVYQGGGCGGGSYVKKPHWNPGFGQQGNSSSRGTRSYGSYNSYSSGSC